MGKQSQAPKQPAFGESVAVATICVNEKDKVTGITLCSEQQKPLWEILDGDVYFAGFDSLKQQFDEVERTGKVQFVRANEPGFKELIKALKAKGLITNPEEVK
jgi:hypothetical protein